MTPEERLEICRECPKAKHNMMTGRYCGLTGQKPDFEEACEHFQPENKPKRQQESNNSVHPLVGVFIGACVMGMAALFIIQEEIMVPLFFTILPVITIAAKLSGFVNRNH